MPCKRLTVAFLLVMFAGVLFVEPLPVHAASSLVQQKTNLNVDGGGLPHPGITISASFSAAVTSGNVIVVAVQVANGVYYTPAVVNSIADSLGSSFTQAVDASYSSMHVYIYYATLSSSGPDTVTATFNVDLDDLSGWASIYIYEVSGVTTTGVATGTGFGTVSGSGTISTSSTNFQNGAFLLAIMVTDIVTVPGGSWGAGSGFQFSPNHPYDQFIRLTKAMYSTSGVSSPTTFPATLSRPGYNPNWVEAGIALNPETSLSVEDPITHLNTLSVTTGSSFRVDIWIRNIPSNDPMDSFSLDLAWDPAFIQYDHSQGNPPSGWSADVNAANAASGTLNAGGVMLQSGNSYSDDHMWLSVYFRCLKSGVGKIDFPSATWMDDVGGFQLSFDSVLSATISQTVLPPVGGVILPTSKLEILTPYLALVVLVTTITTSAIIIKKKYKP